MKKIFIRIVAGLSIFIGGLTVIVAGLAFWVFQHPRETFEVIQKHFLPADLKLAWRDAEFSMAWLGGVDIQFDLTIEGLEVSKRAPSLLVPLDHARIRASVFPLRRSAQVHLIEARASKQLIYRANRDADPSPEKNPFQQIQSVLEILRLIHDRLPVEAADLEIAEFVFYPFQGPALNIRATVKQNVGSPMALSTSLDLPSSSKLTLSLDAEVDFAKMDSPAPFLKAKVSFNGRGTTTEQIVIGSYNGENARLTSYGPIDFKDGKIHLMSEPRLDANFNPRLADLELAADIRGIPGPLARVDQVKLRLKTPLEAGKAWSRKPSSFSLEAPIELFFVDRERRKKMEASCKCKLPERLNAAANGNIWLETFLSERPEKRAALETALRVESVNNKIFSVDLAGKLLIEKESKKFNFYPEVDGSATIHSFKAFQPLLDAYNLLIPAPIDVLDGTLIFKAAGPVSRVESGSTFPLSLNLDLSSSSQKVKITSNATVALNHQFSAAHADVKAKVANLYLDLPPLDPIGGLPRVAPDSRFKKAAPAAKSGPARFKLSLNFEVETESDGAIRLSSRYFTPYLPLTLKIQSDGAKDNSGFIRSEPFNVTYLRRTVRVENIRIGLDSDDKGVFPLKGRISVKQTDYTVFIDVEGTTKSPNITMSSEPYLPQNDIIAVLLYDRINDQLVSGDAEAAGGVQAAIADRAIGLFGLWAFAATPIKSFSYNPVTKVYTATVAVSDDLTAGIGTNWEESAHLELRKRVSKRWSLTAAFSPATQEESSSTKLVLQWEKRF